ncbi:MAG: septum formation initiator family protein [Rickettsiaceae bacterium]
MNKYFGQYKTIIINFIIVLILAYFVYHSVYGQKGVLSYFKRTADLEKLNEQLTGLHFQRAQIEHKVNLFKSGDKDIIDEYARKILNLASPDEQIFIKQ